MEVRIEYSEIREKAEQCIARHDTSIRENTDAIHMRTQSRTIRTHVIAQLHAKAASWSSYSSGSHRHPHPCGLSTEQYT